MGDRGVGATPGFGGPWTLEKLGIVERYLRAYCKVFKNQQWCRLVYLDAFAGTGRIIRELEGDDGADTEDGNDFIMGSAERALTVDGRPFDLLVFVEKERERCARLEELRGRCPGRLIDVANEDANDFLSALNHDTFLDESRSVTYRDWRGVLFVDPFGTQLDWTTVEHIASLERLDMWLLFPVGAIARMLPRSRDPSRVNPKWADKLSRVFGGDGWRDLYDRDPQSNLFGTEESVRAQGVDGLMGIYKDQLRGIFGARLLEESRTLRNSINSPLFELIFCVGSSSPKAIGAAKRIAKDLITDISKNP